MRGDGEDDPDKLELQQYRKRVRSVSALFLRGSNNAVEEIEKLGFTYVVDENEDGDEIDEERSARPITADQISLVSYLESTVSPDEDWLTLCAVRQCSMTHHLLCGVVFSAQEIRN
jgi:hypothetical protein